MQYNNRSCYFKCVLWGHYDPIISAKHIVHSVKINILTCYAFQGFFCIFQAVFLSSIYPHFYIHTIRGKSKIFSPFHASVYFWVIGLKSVYFISRYFWRFPPHISCLFRHESFLFNAICLTILHNANTN